MPAVLSLVNTISSTSIPVEIAHAVNKYTSSNVTVGALLESANMALDPDVRAMNLEIEFFNGVSNFDPKLYCALVTHLRANKYDVIHTHHNFSGSVSRLLSRLLNIPIVNTEHNDHQHFSLAQRAANAITFMLPAANVHNSYSTKSSIGPLERRFSRHDEVIYNGVDISRIESSKNYPLPVEIPDGTLVTNVGVMTEQKNQVSILEMAQEVKRREANNDIRFIIAGSGPMEDKLRSGAVEMGVEDLVTFTGYLPEREHVYSLLHQSDVFLNPSFFEGFCVAAVEAMACKLPVISSDISVLQEVLGGNGIFVPPRDIKGMTDRLLEITSDSNERRRRGIALHDRAVSKFPLTRTANNYHELYARIAN
jgi:glycosyltransferase involved in cell wall biosynthesis